MASHHDTGYKELFSHPEFVEALFDVKEHGLRLSGTDDNLLQLVFNVENALSAEDMQRVAVHLAKVISYHPDKERMDKVLVSWFKRFLRQNKITIDLNAINSLQEIPPMLANRSRQLV